MQHPDDLHAQQLWAIVDPDALHVGEQLLTVQFDNGELAYAWESDLELIPEEQEAPPPKDPF
jgi:hypothetical protein